VEQKAWVGTGQIVMVPGEVNRIPDFDPRTGEHLWTMITMYRWGGPQVEQHTLDQENLLALEGPGCYYCAEPYSDYTAKRRCSGRRS
jgi:hypothetical protein